MEEFKQRFDEVTPKYATWPKQNIIDKVEAAISKEVNDRYSKETHGDFINVSITIPDDCETWHVFNYLYCVGYITHAPSFSKTPCVRVNIKEDMCPAAHRYNKKQKELDDAAIANNVAFVSNTSNLFGAIKYLYADEVIIFLFEKYPWSNSTREFSQLCKYESIESGLSVHDRDGCLEIRADAKKLSTHEIGEDLFLKTLALYARRYFNYVPRVPQEDREALEKFYIESKSAVDNKLDENAKIHVVLSPQTRYLLELYGYRCFSSNGDVTRDSLFDIARSVNYTGNGDAINPVLPTIKDFARMLAADTAVTEPEDSENNTAKRRRIIEIYKQPPLSSHYLANDDIVHTFNSPETLFINPFQRKKIEDDMGRLMEEVGVKRRFQFIPNGREFSVWYRKGNE